MEIVFKTVIKFLQIIPNKVMTKNYDYSLKVTRIENHIVIVEHKLILENIAVL